MSAPPCAALSPTGYACTLDKGHAGDHEARRASGRAHAFAMGPVVATWPRSAFEGLSVGDVVHIPPPGLDAWAMRDGAGAVGLFRVKDISPSALIVEPVNESAFEAECQTALDADDRQAHEAALRGDAPPEEVADRRGQMRVVR